MVNIGSKPDQNKDFAAEEERYHDFDDIVYDINLIPEEEKRAIVETENSKLIQCLQKNSYKHCCCCHYQTNHHNCFGFTTQYFPNK